MAQQIILRNGTAAQWTLANPVLAMAEFGLENDTGNYKLGDGLTAWNALPYSGVTGPTGPMGPAGKTLLNGGVNPGPGDGVDGDFYINTVTNFIFGPKASGVWPSGVSIVGPQGNPGATHGVYDGGNSSSVYGGITPIDGGNSLGV